MVGRATFQRFWSQKTQEMHKWQPGELGKKRRNLPSLIGTDHAQQRMQQDGVFCSGEGNVNLREHLKIGFLKRKVVFQAPFFRGYVSFREGILFHEIRYLKLKYGFLEWNIIILILVRERVVKPTNLKSTGLVSQVTSSWSHLSQT